MGAKVRRKKHEAEGNIFWVTMSDLFIGMFMIFATLFFAFCANTSQSAESAAAQATKEAVQQVADKMQGKNINVVEKKIVNEQTKEEAELGKKVDVEIDPFTGMARITNLELFELNSSTLTPVGKKFLTAFLPVYFDAVLNSDLKKYVAYVVIQGHTDSNLFRGSYTPEQQYMKNMNLSMNRAYNVAQFMFDICKTKPYYKDLTHIVRVEGASFSRPITVEGKEDFTKSRRVELVLVLRQQKLEVLQQFLREGAGAGYEKL